jgi:hypothetical protein
MVLQLTVRLSSTDVEHAFVCNDHRVLLGALLLSSNDDQPLGPLLRALADKTESENTNHG